MTKGADQFVGGVETLEAGQLTAPQRLDHLDRRRLQIGRCDIAEEPRPHRVERHRAAVVLKQGAPPDRRWRSAA
jgi:hypothetical protein